MRRISVLAALIVVSSASGQAQAPAGRGVVPASGGNISITPIKHASFQIDYNNLVIQVDPVSANDNSKAAKADIILVTDIHGDHMDAKAIDQLRKSDGRV